MNKKYKRIIALLVLVSIFILPFVVLDLIVEDNTQIAKNEFSKYYNGKDEVVLNIEDNLYFEKHILDIKRKDESFVSNSIIFYDDLIYFLSLDSSQMGFKNKNINVYACDIFGENILLIHSKQLNIYSKISIKILNDTYFIRYKKDGVFFIDQYTISSNIYKTIDSGKNCNLSDYIPKEESSKYEIKMKENISTKKHGEFIITDLETGEKRTINDNYLSDTIYIDSLNKFNYGPKRFDISNGHILLTYSIGAGDGWNYPHLVFEYNFEKDILEYKMLVFPYDNVPVEIIYIGD